MQAGPGGVPDPATVQNFAQGSSTPVDLEFDAPGQLYYADIAGGEIKRINFTTAGNQPPTALAQADPQGGDVPLTVDFDATGSSDPNPGDTLTYKWDLDGDGQLDDSTAAQPSFTYNAAGVYTVTLEVTDTGVGLGHGHRHDQRRQRPADGEHRRPHLRDDVARRSDDQLLRVRLGSRGRCAAGVSARLVADTAPLLDADRLPRASTSRTSRTLPAAPSPLRTTSTRLTWSCA